MKKEQENPLNADQIAIIEHSRQLRQLAATNATKLIRDIRISFTYQIPKELLYLNRYAEIVLQHLITKGLMCPVYDHLYITIANTREEALQNIVLAEDWHTSGIAVLPAAIFLNADEETQQALVLTAIKDGLMDIAILDKLDTNTIASAIEEAGAAGILRERTLKTKDNKKIAFTISLKGILKKYEEEIYFTILNKATNKKVKWKFGQENIFLVRGWFGAITVTNKKITIKPRANMDMVLKGRQKIITLNVEEQLPA
ncbi:hypothetical protein [Ferruginibacter profundus]